MDAIIRAGNRSLEREEQHWQLPQELVLMILQVLVARYYAFSEAEQSYPHGPCWQALHDIINFSNARKQWSDDLFPAENDINFLAIRARCVTRWQRVSRLLEDPVMHATSSQQPEFTFPCMPAVLRQRLHNQVIHLAEKMDLNPIIHIHQ